MDPLLLHEFHAALGAHFAEVNGMEVVSDYGDSAAEYRQLTSSAAILDLSFRGRICLTGTDRVRFLHGQVTNDIKRLGANRGCYAALVTAKGKMQSDLNVYALPEELLLDFEPGLTKTVSDRLEKYLVADDVQVVDVSAHYGQLSAQGPKTFALLERLALFEQLPKVPFELTIVRDSTLGELYAVNHPRVNTVGVDLYVPTAALEAVADKLVAAAKSLGGGAGGWTALEMARIEAGIPRFGQDMDESHFPQECGIEDRAVSYTKGCYIGQEILNRLHTMGHVNQQLRALQVANGSETLPVKGDPIFHGDKQVGLITSAVKSPGGNTRLALGYVRREANQPGTELTLRTSKGQSQVTILPLVAGTR
jgi:folate-binding protein YgfZ